MTAGPGKIEAASGASQGAAARGLWTRFGVSPVVALFAAVLLLLIIPPLVFLIKTSFYTTTFTGDFDKFTVRFYIELVSDPKFLTSLLNTATYAIGSACVAIGLGVIQAWIV